MRTRTNLNTPPATDSPVIAFPSSTAQKWILPNGLTIIIQEDHSAPIASVQAWCATGSIYEDEHLGAGLSHILEHMLFKGTRKRSTNEIAQKIQDVGGYINAYTSFDRTVFWTDVPKDGVSTALDILADAMMNSTLPAEEYAREQEVIRREFAMGLDDPERTLTLLLFATAYQQHPYRLPVIGLRDIYNQLTRDEVVEYYKRRYVPNNLTFIVVGDVEATQVREQLEKSFQGQPAKSLQPIYLPPEPPQLGRREVHQEFTTELTHLAMAWHVPRISHPDVPVLDLLSLILGEGRSSQLHRKLREEARLAYSIAGFCYTPGEPGLFGIDAVLEPKNREAALQLIVDIVNQVQSKGVEESELAKVKKIALADELSALATMRGQASDLGTNWFFTRNLNFSREYLEKVQRITSDDVARVARQYLTDDNLSIVSLNPKGSLGQQEKVTRISTLSEVEKFTLSNGLRLLVREDPRLPLVWMCAVFRCGLLAETEKVNGITRLTAKSLLKGTTTRTAEQIADQIEAVGGGIESKGGNNTISVKIDITRPDLAVGADILADVLLNSTMPAEEVERETEIQLAKIREEDQQPTSVARNALKRALFRDHPLGLRREGTTQSVQRLTPRDLCDFRDRYITARNGVVAIFGDVKSAEVKQLMEQKLGSMPPGELALTRPAVPVPLTESRIVVTERDKVQAVLMIGYRGTDLGSPDCYALDLIEDASSDLGSRFFVRIREGMGLAYFIGAAQLHALVPGMFAFYLGTDPHQIEAVQEAFLDEITKLSSKGLTEVELARAKRKLIGQQHIQHQSNDTFAYMTALDELYGLGFDHYKGREAAINRVTLVEIKRVAARYFAQQRHVLSIVRPPSASSATKPK